MNERIWSKSRTRTIIRLFDYNEAEENQVNILITIYLRNINENVSQIKYFD